MAKRITRKQEKRIDDASRKLEEALKLIEPYSTPRKMGSISTEGKWKSTSTAVDVCTRDNFHNVLKGISPQVEIDN